MVTIKLVDCDVEIFYGETATSKVSPANSSGLEFHESGFIEIELSAIKVTGAHG